MPRRLQNLYLTTSQFSLKSFHSSFCLKGDLIKTFNSLLSLEILSWTYNDIHLTFLYARISWDSHILTLSTQAIIFDEQRGSSIEENEVYTRLYFTKSRPLKLDIDWEQIDGISLKDFFHLGHFMILIL